VNNLCKQKTEIPVSTKRSFLKMKDKMQEVTEKLMEQATKKILNLMTFGLNQRTTRNNSKSSSQIILISDLSKMMTRWSTWDWKSIQPFQNKRFKRCFPRSERPKPAIKLYLRNKWIYVIFLTNQWTLLLHWEIWAKIAHSEISTITRVHKEPQGP